MTRQTPKAAPSVERPAPTRDDMPPTAPPVDPEIREWIVVAAALSLAVGTHKDAEGKDRPTIQRLGHGDVLRGRADHPDIAYFVRTASVVPREEFKGQRLTLAGAARAMGGELDAAAADALAARPATSKDIDPGGVIPGNLTPGDLDG